MADWFTAVWLTAETSTLRAVPSSWTVRLTAMYVGVLVEIRKSFPDSFSRRRRVYGFSRMVGVALLAGALAGGCYSGRIEKGAPAVVAGSSMAPHLLGEHVQLQCPSCRYSFAADAARPPADRRAVCPNCGWSEIDWSTGRLRPADAVTIAPIAKSIERWAVVAIRKNSSDPHAFVVKRVVGLPGETVSVAKGSVLVNGHPPARPWPVQKEMRIPVFDSAFHPVPQQFDRSRWRLYYRNGRSPDSDGSDLAKEDWEHWEPVEKLSDIDLTRCAVGYRHRPGYRVNPGLSTTGAIQDDYAYNQNLSRSLHEVPRLFVQLDLELEPGAQVELKLPRLDARVRCRLEPDGSVRVGLLAGDRRWESRMEAVREGSVDHLSVELSNFNQDWMVAINGTILVLQPLGAGLSEPGDDRDESAGTTDATGATGAIGDSLPSDASLVAWASGKPVHLRRLRVWRDIYYFDETGTLAPPGLVVPSDGYIVLGDNVPRSDDARYWSPAWTTRDSIIGKVVH